MKLDKSYRMFWSFVVIITVSLVGYIVYEEQFISEGKTIVSDSGIPDTGISSVRDAHRYAIEAKRSSDACHEASKAVLNKAEEVRDHVQEISDISLSYQGLMKDHQKMMFDLVDALVEDGLLTKTSDEVFE